MSSFFRNFLFSRSPPVGTVDNGKVSSSPNHSEEEKTKRLVSSAPAVLQKPPKEIPQLDARSLANDFHQQQNPIPPIRTHTRTPTLADIQVDVIEWCCHNSLMERDPFRLTILQQELSVALGDKPRHSSGRLYSRLHIVALWNDVGCMHIEEGGGPRVPTRRDDFNIHSAQGSRTASSASNDETKETSRTLNSSTNVSAAQWYQITEQLVLVRGHLLRLDANLVVPTLRQVPATSRNDEKDPPDYAVTKTGRILPSNEQVANYDLFQQDYQHVLLLFQVQQALARLRESLDETNMDGTYYLISESSLQRAADACQGTLVRIFGNQENQSDDGGGLPESLSFLLHRKANTDGADESGADLLRQDITAICLDETHEFSHARLKENMHALLIQWSDSILDIPTLVELGYGGVTIPVARNAGDDVAPLDNREEQGQNVDDEQQPLLTQTQNHLENGQRAVQKMPQIDDRAHANNDDSYGDDQPLMTQSQNHLENGQHAVQHDGTVNSKNDFVKDGDPDDISEQEGSGGGGSARGFIAVDAEKDREKLGDLSGKGDRHKQREYVPSAELLRKSTDVVFNEIADPDAFTTADIHMSLCKRYGFKLCKFEKKIVEKRLTELMNANNTSAPTATANCTVSTATRKRSMSSDDSGIEYEQYPPRLSFKTTDHAASAKPRNAISAKQLDSEAVDVETTANGDLPSRQKKRPLVVIDVDKKRRAMPVHSRASDKRAHVNTNLGSDSDSSVSWACPSPVLKQVAFVKPTSKNHTNRKIGRWSEEEVEAVRQGVARFGKGKWKEIRDSNGHLSRRTGPQIKDKYRVLVGAAERNILQGGRDT